MVDYDLFGVVHLCKALFINLKVNFSMVKIPQNIVTLPLFNFKFSLFIAHRFISCADYYVLPSLNQVWLIDLLIN